MRRKRGVAIKAAAKITLQMSTDHSSNKQPAPPKKDTNRSTRSSTRKTNATSNSSMPGSNIKAGKEKLPVTLPKSTGIAPQKKETNRSKRSSTRKTVATSNSSMSGSKVKAGKKELPVTMPKSTSIGAASRRPRKTASSSSGDNGDKKPAARAKKTQPPTRSSARKIEIASSDTNHSGKTMVVKEESATSSTKSSRAKRKIPESEPAQEVTPSKRRKVYLQSSCSTSPVTDTEKSVRVEDSRYLGSLLHTDPKREPKEDDSLLTNDDRVWASEIPFHVDVSGQKAFYTAIKVEPPIEHYAESVKTSLGETVWTVKVGDTVAIHVSLDRTAQNRIDKNLKGGYNVYPYTVTWWIAEVVTIYKSLGVSEGQELRKKVSAGLTLDGKQQERGFFQIEVRWLYRKVDIPGAFNRKTNNCDNIEGLEEVFETDDVDEIGAMSLLGPVMVYSEAKLPQDLPMSTNDLPLTHFFSRRSWSLYRKTLMPIGSAENRIQRGMLYSKYMHRGSAARTAFEEELLNTTPTHVIEDKNRDWREVFQKAIAALTPARVSAVECGSQLIGRTAEQKRINNFLSNAICAVNAKEGVDVSNANMFTLFVAGSPGTGKTSSVTSILYQLRQEQAKGNIPEFTSVMLNGMETRHPFDIYVRLWESVSPNRERASADEALARLELYFAGKESSKRKSTAEHVQKRRAIVLIVDEIDYLRTKKQTVLYNLFDWPVRGYNGNAKAQLIVIGISNTLNLPDELHVRLQSRMGRERCYFQSYNVDQSMRILKGKLGGVSESDNQCIFTYDAIKFAAKKIASESGDIRKVFHLCRATAENVLRDLNLGKRIIPYNGSKPPGANMICIREIQDTARKIFGTVLCRAVSTASIFETLLFISLASLRRTSGQERGRFNIEEVLTKMEGIASASGNTLYFPAPSYHEIVSMLPRLAESGIISLATPNGTNGMFGANMASDTVLGLNMEDYEILGALKDTQHQALAEKHLQTKTFIL